jgi:hypothetical protein
MPIDLTYKNNDIALTENYLTITDKELLIQRLAIKFKWFESEYTYDTSYGIPYFTEILGNKRLDIYDMFNLLISKIEEEDGITKAELEDFDFDEVSRKMKITFAITSIYGNFTQTLGL